MNLSDRKGIPYEFGLGGKNITPDGNKPCLRDILVALLTESTLVKLNPVSWYLATGAPLAVFADGASAVPGSEFTGSEAFGIRWNNHATPNAIVASFIMPEHVDVTKDATLTIRASKIGATLADAVTFTVTAFGNPVGAAYDADANFGGVSSAMTGNATTKTVQAVTLTLAAADLPPAGTKVTISIKPTAGTLGTDDLLFHGATIDFAPKAIEP